MDTIEHDDVNKATTEEGNDCLLLMPPPPSSSSIKSNDITESMQDLAEESSKTDDDLDNKVCSNDKSNENLLNGKIINDGSDSGVEIGASSIISVTTVNGIIFQRALSSNSGGYASSTGGLDENVGPVSCNSSMISCCSDTCEKLTNTLVVDGCASEGGSESSSVAGGPTTRNVKKKVSMKDSPNKSPRRSNESNSSQKSSSSRVSVTRSNTLPTKSVAPNLLTRDRARSRDKPKPEAPSSCQGDIMTTSLTRSSSLKRPPKPDSFPMSLSLTSPRVNLSRTPSLSRNRTPLATPVDDGRWPSINNKSIPRNMTPRAAVSGGGGVVGGSGSGSQSLQMTTPDSLVIKTRIGNIQLESKSSALDKYGTLPRRRKERTSMEELNFKLTPDSRSSSTTRNELRLSSLTLAVKKEAVVKPLINYPKIAKKPNVKKTKIFHETSIQTAITGDDLAKLLNGNAIDLPRIDAVEMVTRATQSDFRDKELEKLREQLERLSVDHSQLLSKLNDKTHVMANLEQELLKEREEKLTVQKELQNNTERVMCMLESFQFAATKSDSTTSTSTVTEDSFVMLESQLTMSGSVLEKQQEEIVKLQGICRSLQRDMERSLRIQDDLIKQRNELEEESNELQDFLQAEKVAFMDALKEAENENQQHKAKIAQRDNELERMKEECRHLVRAGEQKR